MDTITIVNYNRLRKIKKWQNTSLEFHALFLVPAYILNLLFNNNYITAVLMFLVLTSLSVFVICSFLFYIELNLAKKEIILIENNCFSLNGKVYNLEEMQLSVAYKQKNWRKIKKSSLKKIVRKLPKWSNYLESEYLYQEIEVNQEVISYFFPDKIKARESLKIDETKTVSVFERLVDWMGGFS